MPSKRKLPAKLGQPTVKQSAKPLTKEIVDDAAATVTTGGFLPNRTPVNGDKTITIQISSQSGSDVDDEDEEIEEDQGETGENAGNLTRKTITSAAGDDEEMADPNAPLPEDDELAEPTFGDLVRVSASEPIDVAAAFESSPAAAPHPRLAAPSGASLTTVLTQALKTNDRSLLESCLQTTDVQTIRSTIQRLSSPLASTLLSQLAARLHRRPGRSASIMVWVQWTLVMHGGYLATQAELVKQLAALNRVIDQRARGLQGLLALKGKLDMLEAQGQLRRSMQSNRWGADDDAEEEDALYIEGEDNIDSELDEPRAIQVNGVKSDVPDVSDEESGVDMPTIREQDDASEGDDGSSADDNMIDDEASESENDSIDEDEVDYDDVDSIEEDDESDDAAPARTAPPAKLQKKAGLFSKVR